MAGRPLASGVEVFQAEADRVDFTMAARTLGFFLVGAYQEILGDMLAEVRMGDVRDMSNFLGAVIDASSFETQKSAIDAAKANPACDIVFGGECDDSTGWFVAPTVIESQDPRSDTMCRELFGPVLTVHVYEDAEYASTLETCATGSEYALTGAVSYTHLTLPTKA